MAFYSKFQEDKAYYLPLLLIISVVSHFPFVLKGFGEIDATKIAVSVIDILNNGSNATFANFYFTDVIPLYILYLKWFMKLLHHNYSYLPIVMNYTNAVIGTLIIIPSYLLIKQLFGNAAIAFCSVLALIFAPSFYQSTIMGFPHLIALFFLLVSLCYYLSGLDHTEKTSVYVRMFLSCAFLTVAFLFKSDYILASGVYIGFLFMRKVRDRGKITSALVIIFIAGLLFLLFRNLMLGPSSGTTMSKEGLSKWYNYSLIIPSTIGYFITQTKPIAYGTGIATFCLGGIAFIFYLFKRRPDILIFFISWAAIPSIFWLIMIGNNARHNMITVLPLLTIIVLFFHEKAPRYLTVLTALLILGNYFLTSPSFSILTPSGNLFVSNTMLKERMMTFQARAKEIAIINDDKIVVLGYFHNPNVVFELISSAPNYKASKIGREDYKIQIGDREYVFIYFTFHKPEDIEEETDYILQEYQLHDYLFVSTTYNLTPLKNRGLKIKNLDIIKRDSL